MLVLPFFLFFFTDCFFFACSFACVCFCFALYCLFCRVFCFFCLLFACVCFCLLLFYLCCCFFRFFYFFCWLCDCCFFYCFCLCLLLFCFCLLFLCVLFFVFFLFFFCLLFLCFFAVKIILLCLSSYFPFFQVYVLELAKNWMTQFYFRLKNMKLASQILICRWCGGESRGVVVSRGLHSLKEKRSFDSSFSSLSNDECQVAVAILSSLQEGSLGRFGRSKFTWTLIRMVVLVPLVPLAAVIAA